MPMLVLPRSARADNRARRWLGVFQHRVIVYRLNEDQRRGGQALADFMRHAAGG